MPDTSRGISRFGLKISSEMLKIPRLRAPLGMTPEVKKQGYLFDNPLISKEARCQTSDESGNYPCEVHLRGLLFCQTHFERR